MYVPIEFQGALMGKGGDHIESLRKQSGCKIEVCIWIKHYITNLFWKNKVHTAHTSGEHIQALPNQSGCTISV